MMRKHPTITALYAIAGAQAFIFQAFIRLQECSGLVHCSVSLTKGFVWSVMWPIYWAGYFLFF